MASRHYGLIGEEIARSPSPAMHNAAFAALGLPSDYALRPTPPQALDEVFHELAIGRWAGLNVTRPLKVLIADRVTLDAAAARARAVNTLVHDGGCWRGFLTDIEGIAAPLKDRGVSGDAGLILGAGGAARAAAVALEGLGLTVHVLARNVAQACALLDEVRPLRPGSAFGIRETGALAALFADLSVVINASPVGATGDRWTLPWQEANRQLVAFDMIYAPRRTPFLGEAVSAGLGVIEGWEMLVGQGAKSFSLWTGQAAPVAVMARAALDCLID